MTPLRRFFRLLKTQRLDLTNIYIYAIFNGLLNLSIPLGISAIINLIQGGRPSTSWVILVVLVLVGLTLAGIFQIFQLISAERIQQRIFTNASVEFAYRLPRLRISALKADYPPELVNRFFDIITLQKGLSKFLFDFSMAAIQITFGLLLLALYHPFFIGLGFFVFAGLGLFFWATSGRGLRTSLEESKFKYRLVGWLEEVARNLSTFKMAGRTDLPLEKTDHLTMDYLDARRAHFNVLKLQYVGLVSLKVIIAGSLLLLGGYLVIDQQMNIGQFVAAEIIILQVSTSVEKLILSMDVMYDLLTGLEKIGSVTDLELEDSQGQEEWPVSPTAISLVAHGVTLPSPQRNRVILHDLNFEIKAGEKVGITGHMGSGKTALLQLVAGLFDQYEGQLRYNNVPARHLDLLSLRSAVGDNLTQEDIFQGSVMENLSLNRAGIDREEVERVLEICGLTSFVEDLPQGLRTSLPTSGLGLARSIRTRLLMARCLAGQHGLLLVEDNWREITRETRLRWLEELTRKDGPTLLMVSQDREILERMDRIITLDQGRIVENKPNS